MAKYEHSSELDSETGQYRTTSVQVGVGVTYIIAESLKTGDVVRYMGKARTVTDVVRVDGKILVEFQHTDWNARFVALQEFEPWARFVLVI